MDVSGERHLDIIEKPLQRHGGRLEHNETYCGSCYGAKNSDDECSNSCEEVHEAYRKKGWGVTNTDLVDQCKRKGFVQKVQEEQGEGCSIHGSLEVNKVAGKIHFSPGKSFHIPGFHLFDFLNLPTENYNMSHKINKLTFGDSIPGIVNPVDGGCKKPLKECISILSRWFQPYTPVLEAIKFSQISSQ